MNCGCWILFGESVSCHPCLMGDAGGSNGVNTRKMRHLETGAILGQMSISNILNGQTQRAAGNVEWLAEWIEVFWYWCVFGAVYWEKSIYIPSLRDALTPALWRMGIENPKANWVTPQNILGCALVGCAYGTIDICGTHTKRSAVFDHESMREWCVYLNERCLCAQGLFILNHVDILVPDTHRE